MKSLHSQLCKSVQPGYPRSWNMLEKETGAKAGHEVMAMPGKQDASSHVSYLTPLSQVVVLLIHSAVPFFFLLLHNFQSPPSLLYCPYSFISNFVPLILLLMFCRCPPLIYNPKFICLCLFCLFLKITGVPIVVYTLHNTHCFP